MPAKAGMSSLPHCGHLLTNNLFMGISSTPPRFFEVLDGHAVTRRHTKKPGESKLLTRLPPLLPALLFLLRHSVYSPG
jgi:hypothetical protein